MAKFLMLGKYSVESMEGMSAQRTEKAVAAIQKAKGKVDGMFALMGPYDLALFVDFPSINDAVSTSITLTRMTRIGFVTMPAIPVSEFDKLMK